MVSSALPQILPSISPKGPVAPTGQIRNPNIEILNKFKMLMSESSKVCSDGAEQGNAAKDRILHLISALSITILVLIGGKVKGKKWISCKA